LPKGPAGRVGCDDALALTTAARFCDLDTREREEMLRRAASAALSKEERWAAQLELADGLFGRNAKQEAPRLAELIIAEAGAPDGSAGPLAEATFLRWRKTRTQSDFETQ
jgi:hypothetical protein